MTDDLLKIINEMKQTAEREPFRMSAYNPVCDPKMARSVVIDGVTMELIFTLDEYPMVPHQMWHLSVTGKIAETSLAEVVKAFYPTGQVMEIPKEELLGVLTESQIALQRQFYQIKA